MCVEAGAGTGKTTMLIRRIVALLREGRATIDRLGGDHLHGEGRGRAVGPASFELEVAVAATADDDERARLEEALLGLHRARVQTIHAFAGDLLRERPVEAGIDPQFRVLEDLAASLDFDAAYRDWLDDLLASSRDGGRGCDAAWVRAAPPAAGRRDHPPAPPRPAAGSRVPAEAPDVAGYRDWAAGPSASWTSAVRHAPMRRMGRFGQLATVREYLALVEEADDIERLSAWCSSKHPVQSWASGQKSNWSPDDELRPCQGRLREIVSGQQSALRDALRTEALGDMLVHVEQFVAEYARPAPPGGQRRLRGSPDLGTRPGARQPGLREHFRRRSTHVLVDEFQDTDPIQAELIAWISAPTGRRAATGATVTPGAREPLRRRRSEAVDLPLPRRGHRRLRRGQARAPGRQARAARTELPLDRVAARLGERAVRPRVRGAAGHPAGEHAPRTRTRRTIDDELDRSAIVVVHSLGEWAKVDESTRGDARGGVLAAGSHDLACGEGGAMAGPRVARQDDAVRPAQLAATSRSWFPSRTRVELLEAALQRHGVPYRLEGGRGFYARQEVRDLDLAAGGDRRPDRRDRDRRGAALAGVRLLGRRAAAVAGRERAVRLPLDQQRRARERARVARGDAPTLHRAQRSLSLGELVRLAVRALGPGGGGADGARAATRRRRTC